MSYAVSDKMYIFCINFLWCKCGSDGYKVKKSSVKGEYYGENVFLKGVDLCVTFEKSIFLLLIFNLKHVKKTFLKGLIRNQLNFWAARPRGSHGRLIKTMIHPLFKLWARFSQNRVFQVGMQDCGKSIQSIGSNFV